MSAVRAWVLSNPPGALTELADGNTHTHTHTERERERERERARARARAREREKESLARAVARGHAIHRRTKPAVEDGYEQDFHLGTLQRWTSDSLSAECSRICFFLGFVRICLEGPALDVRPETDGHDDFAHLVVS